MTKKRKQQMIASILRDLGMEEDVVMTISGLSKQDLQNK